MAEHQGPGQGASQSKAAEKAARARAGRAQATAKHLRRAAIGALAAAAIALGLWYGLLGGASTLTVELGGREIVLLQARWLLVAAVVPYFFVIQRYSLADFSLPQQLISAGVRSLFVLGIAVALARPSTVSERSRVATVFLVDVSDSMSDAQLGRAKQVIDQALAEKPTDDEVSVVTFARRPRRIDLDGGKAPTLVRHSPRGEAASAATDVQAALQLAYGLFPTGYVRRAVIVSDGIETDGDLLAEAYRAKAFGVRVGYHLFKEEQKKEILVRSLTLPEEVRVGDPFELTAEVWSTHADHASMTLYQDDFINGLDGHKVLDLVPGKNVIKWKSKVERAGFVSYRMELGKVGQDTEKQNNQGLAAAVVKGRPRVLLVEGEPQYKDYFVNAMKHENIDVDARGPLGVPSSVKDLEKYDAFILSDVPAQFVGLNQMAAIEQYVKSVGGGFIAVGGQDSFGSGGYNGTRLEKLLPVRFDSEKKRDTPALALILVIDRSGSMSGEPMELAKEAARATAHVLDPQELLGVVAFDNQPTVVVRLQRAANRMRIENDIARIQPGGGTSILPALQEAYQILGPVPAKVKHVILFSDGQANIDGIADAVEEAHAQKITTSAIGLGDADRSLLQMIAERGEGRFYMTQDATQVPKLFVKETSEVQKSTLVEDYVKAHIAKNVEMVHGTDVENAPYLRGYVSTKAKPLSEVVLVSDTSEPLLARWRQGLGWVVAWTSDVKNRWSVDWLRWNGYPKFWAQVVRTSMKHRVLQSFDLSATVGPGTAEVVVDAVGRDDKFINELDTTLEIVDPLHPGQKRSIPMVQAAPGRYQADFSIERYGSFLLKAVHKLKGNTVAESTGSVSFPFPPEYLGQPPDEERLKLVADVSGGWKAPTPEQLFDAGGETMQFHQDLWPYVVLLLLGLYLLDVLLRRVRLMGYRPLKL